MQTICTREKKKLKNDQRIFFHYKTQIYLWKCLKKKKRHMHLCASSYIWAGRSQTRLLGQKRLLRKSLRAIKEVRKQKMQSPSNPSEPQKPLNFHWGFQEWDLVKAESWKHWEAQCQKWWQCSHQGPPWPDPSLHCTQATQNTQGRSFSVSQPPGWGLACTVWRSVKL